MFHTLVDSLWAFFRSRISLMVTLALAALLLLLERLIEQGQSIAFYQAHYPKLGAVITFLELDRVFNSWAFLTIGVILGAFFLTNLVENLYHRHFSAGCSYGGLCLILVGSFLESTLGVRAYLPLPADHFAGVMQQELRYGLSKEIKLPFALRSAEFTIITAGENGRPLNYQSIVEVLYQGQRFTRQLELGAPLELAGYNIGQSSYYKNEAGRLCAIVEITTHPGAYVLILGALLLLVWIALFLAPSLRTEESVADGQQPPNL